MSKLIQDEPLLLNSKLPGAIALFLILGVCASAVMYFITAHGPGVSPDSTIYIEVARELLSGKGLFLYSSPLTHYPPVYPILLALVGLFTGSDTLQAARLVAVSLFGLNTILVALAVYISTDHEKLATVCVVLLFLLSAPILSTHSMAWSEAPFIAFSMAGFILLALHLTHPALKYLLPASIIIGFASATRYIGITLFPTVSFGLLVLSNQGFRKKIMDIVIFTAVSSMPLASWLIRNIMVAQSATNREFVFHPINLNHAREFIIQMYDFVLPISISGWTKAFHAGSAFLFFVLMCIFLLRKTGINTNRISINIALPSLLVIYSIMYVILLSISISFFDALTPVDHRLLLPIFIALLVAFTSVVKSISEQYPIRCAWHIYTFILFFSVSVNALPAIESAMNIKNEGIGYTSRYWMNSACLGSLPSIPETMTIFSNGEEVISFRTHKEAQKIPYKVNPYTCVKNDSYDSQMIQMIRECEKGSAIIIYLDQLSNRLYFPSKEEIESRFSIPLTVKMEDGVIMGYHPSLMRKKQGGMN